MRIFAIGDLHLSFGVANKSMDVFGPLWEGHTNRVSEKWRSVVGIDDLVLIPGDISWAMRLEDAVADLEWIDSLPGTKVMIKGNHDYWWDSLKKITNVLPPSIHVIQNNAFHWKDVAIGGARLWDTPEYSFGEFVEFRENPRQREQTTEDLIQKDLSEKIFNRELDRLTNSLNGMDKKARIRVAMTHYPPIGAKMEPSRASQIVEQHQIQVCVFGHLHNLKHKIPFGEKNGVRYVLSSCDTIDFTPVQVF